MCRPRVRAVARETARNNVKTMSVCYISCVERLFAVSLEGVVLRVVGMPHLEGV